MRTFAYTLVALFALVVSVHALDNLVVGGFGTNYIDQFATNKGFFTEKNLAVTFSNVAGSDQQFDSLNSGAYDIITTAADNVIYRRLNLGHEQYTVVGENSGSPAMWLLGNSNIGNEELADLEGKTILADSTLSGFVIPLKKIFKDAEIPLPDNLLIPSGGLFARINSLIAGTTNATMSLGPLGMAALAKNPQLTLIADFKPLVCPYSGTQFIVLNSWLSSSNEDKLTRFLRAELKAWAYLVNPSNKAEVITYIMTREGVDSTAANQIFDLTIASADVGINPYFVPRRTGMINSIELRADDLKVSRATCLPLSAELVSKPNGWINLSYLQTAAGQELSFWNVYGTYYGSQTCSS